ncbi:hypothetical protein P879_11492 [Paragonimus westermani]|uniref:Protein TEX261 n=1 Tax=Paragonimus westermani TaxID=34504 RepID=A0A8T0DAT0_9TREM|nr:hypothetical protein P879_11492 [Paragonimus westermani]
MVSFLWLLSYLTILLYGFVALFCLAAGLLYVTELVEEYTVTTGKIIRYMIVSEFVLHAVLLFTDSVTYMLLGAALAAHTLYWSLLKHFPAFHFGSFSFIGSLCAFVLHHVAAFNLFNSTLYSFTEMLAYFTFMLWAVPFMFLISLSANDWVLPQTVPFTYHHSPSGEEQPLLVGSHDVVSAYLKKKRRSLYSLLSSFRDYLPSLQSKKGF